MLEHCWPSMSVLHGAVSLLILCFDNKLGYTKQNISLCCNVCAKRHGFFLKPLLIHTYLNPPFWKCALKIFFFKFSLAHKTEGSLLPNDTSHIYVLFFYKLFNKCFFKCVCQLHEKCRSIFLLVLGKKRKKRKTLEHSHRPIWAQKSKKLIFYRHFLRAHLPQKV